MNYEYRMSPFHRVRKYILDSRENPSALRSITFPNVTVFNWAIDWFDSYSEGNERSCVIGPSIFDTWTSLSYSKLSSISSRVAQNMIRRGVKKGDRVILECASCVELYAILMAILKVGAVAIPVHRGLHSRQFLDRVCVAAPSWIITDVDRRNFQASVVTMSECFDFGYRDSEDMDYPEVLADDPAFGVFTSGTTGRPKLVLHSQRTHGVAHLSSLAWNDLSEDDIHLNVSSPGWAKFFWSSFLVPLTSGATVLIKPDSASTREILGLIRDYGVTSLCAPVPFLAEAASAEEAVSIRSVTSVGETVPADLVDSIMRKWGVHVRSGYGQSEATAILGELDGHPGVLSVLPGYEVRVKEYDGDPAGRLEYRSFSGGSFIGYATGQDIVAPEVDSSGWQWSGDFARGIPGEPGFRILGRGDDVFRADGHLVAPAEVEQLVARHPDVSAAAVVPFSEDGVNRIAGLVVMSDGAVECLESIRLWVSERLPGDLQIARIDRVGSLPMSINGKVQRKLLAERYQM